MWTKKIANSTLSFLHPTIHFHIPAKLSVFKNANPFETNL